MVTDVQPARQLDVQGRLQLDWADYDRLVSGVLDGTAIENRIPAMAWPMPVNERNPAPDLYGGWGSDAYAQMLVEYLRQCVTHFHDRRWLDRHFVWIPPPSAAGAASAYSQFAWLGGIIQRADTRLSLVCDLSPQPLKPFGCVDDRYQDVGQFVGIWAPPTRVADEETFAALRAAGKRTWLQPDRPPFSGSLSVIAPAVHARSLAWQARRFGCEAIFLPRIIEWPDSGEVTEAVSPGVLVWPGKPYGLDHPVPSIRLKRILRGVQDYEYLWLLKQNQRPAVADLIAADLFAFGGTGCYGEHFLDSRPDGWVDDPAAWELARSLMAGEIVAAMEAADRPAASQPAVDEATIDFAHRLDWRRHVEGVRRINTCVEGARVRLDPQRGEHPLTIQATVVTFNATRAAYSGALSFGELPSGWEAPTAPSPIEELRPTRTTLRAVEALAASIPTNLDGIVNLGIEATPRGGKPADLAARLCTLTAQRLVSPVVMDGRLTDWPLATNNAAGDFVLVGALDSPKVGRASPDSPSQPTIVFAGRDNDALYLAFNCQDNQLAARIITRSNQVTYDDLWPAGEDVIEIVLDPT
ncbi:MAG: DUF4091 domain-containing protein, partial [Planctomycetes bacterium]|nr:DUF4091 domain-containing protein [Planctomycetota bacterium]